MGVRSRIIVGFSGERSRWKTLLGNFPPCIHRNSDLVLLWFAFAFVTAYFFEFLIENETLHPRGDGGYACMFVVYLLLNKMFFN